jgi:predicted XRE-type DNA-binding protein
MRRRGTWDVSTKKKKPIKFEGGSGNVFADVRLKDAD